ncbi:MAG: hypothetical protein M0R37_13695 [Bacteroidales bacterium]|jgi:hypothetical protein|nr:hypothetical protein [Bacteroidales bacterium]
MKPANITSVINVNSQFGKLVWEEAVQARPGHERRVAIAESDKGYVVLAAVCDPKKPQNPAWARRSEFKREYQEAWAIAEQLYRWACEYARENGYVPPCDALAGAR